MHKWSIFNIQEKIEDGVLIKNNLTGSVVYINDKNFKQIEFWLNKKSDVIPHCVNEMINEEIGKLVKYENDECGEYKKIFKQTRATSNIFTLNFLPTTNCQLKCSYCFENGIHKNEYMSNETIKQTLVWLDSYFNLHKKISELRIEIFGGEPLLRKDIIKKAIPLLYRLSQTHKQNFCVGLVSNGELLDKKTAQFLKQYNWNRAQITLDRPKETHNKRRIGKNNRPTFDKIIRNILTITEKEYIKKIDLRINFDLIIADKIFQLLEYLTNLKLQNKVSLTFALINSNFEEQCKSTLCTSKISNEDIANVYISFYEYAKKLKFNIQEEFVSGPFCIATLKHTAVLQPNGFLQKCFCTIGKSEYNFDSIQNMPKYYAKDKRFELFTKRTKKCIEEKCELLPICGGGCIHNSLIKNGKNGFIKEFCEKNLLMKINKALLRINYDI